MSVQGAVDKAGPGTATPAHGAWWMRAWTRRLVLLILALVPLLTPVVSPKDDGPFVYPYCAAMLVISAWFCRQAARRYPEEKIRWNTVAMSQVLHAVAYLITTADNLDWLPVAKGAWVANACVSVSWVLFLPALMGVRAVRGRWVRAVDYVLAVGTAALIMRAMGSGAMPNQGFSRVIVVMLTVVFLAAAALVASLASVRPSTKVFVSVMTAYLATCVVMYFLLDIVNLYWMPEPNILASDLLIAVPEVLLCEWATSWRLRPVALGSRLSPALVDSLQPSILAIGSVLLALYGFRMNAVFAGGAVIAIMICYALRTQLFYYRLFEQQKELRTQADKMEALATRDPLTGVGNRRWFDEEAMAMLSAGRSYPCSLALVDTDRFKEINDNFGHPLGDEVLRAVALALTEVTAHVKRGACARIGGDEFGALWPGTDAAQAMELAEMLRARMETVELPAPVRVTVSMGVATTHEPLGLMKLMRWADSALYRAKAAGRNVVRGIDLGALREDGVEAE